MASRPDGGGTEYITKPPNRPPNKTAVEQRNLQLVSLLRVVVVVPVPIRPLPETRPMPT